MARLGGRQPKGRVATLRHVVRCIRRERTSEAAPGAVRQAVGGGCQSGWGRLLSITTPLKLALAVRGTVAGHMLGALEGGGYPPPPFQCISAHGLFCNGYHQVGADRSVLTG